MLARPGYAGQLGPRSHWQKSCRSSPHTTTSTFWGGLDFIFSWYAGQAGLCRAAGASQPLAKKKRAAALPHGRTGIFFLGKIPESCRTHVGLM